MTQVFDFWICRRIVTSQSSAHLDAARTLVAAASSHNCRALLQNKRPACTFCSLPVGCWCETQNLVWTLEPLEPADISETHHLVGPADISVGIIYHMWSARQGGARRKTSRRTTSFGPMDVFVGITYHMVSDGVWWPTDLISGYKRGPGCRINSTCT
jgi:hypothetical protein